MNETTYLDLIMKNPTVYRKITHKDIGISNTVHVAINYVDDSNNQIGSDSYKELEAYLRNFITLLIH